MDRYQELHAKLAAAGQQQLLRFWSQLDADQQARLAGQLDDIDFAELEKLIKEYVLQRFRATRSKRRFTRRRRPAAKSCCARGGSAA